MADERLTVTNVSNDASAGGTTAQAAVVLHGRGVPGEVVTLYVYSDVPLVATATVNANGEWQYAIDDPLGDGVHEAYVAVNDDTGRVTRKSNPLAFIIQAAQAVSPSVLAAPPVSQAPDVNVTSTSAPTQNLGLYIVGGVMLLLVVILIIVIIVFTRKRY